MTAENGLRSTDRAGRIALVAHCLLNSATRVHGASTWGGALAPFAAELIASGVGIVQLPCPEIAVYGMGRPMATLQDYDTAAYRERVREVLAPALAEVVALAADGAAIEAVWGVSGSPSCGACETSVRASGADGASCRAVGSGILMQELAAMLAERGLATDFTDAPR